MIYFTAHTFKCVCHCRRVMFRVLGMYNFGVCCDYFYYCTEVRFVSFLSVGFTTMAVINPPEKKLAIRTSVYCMHAHYNPLLI